MRYRRRTKGDLMGCASCVREDERWRVGVVHKNRTVPFPLKSQHDKISTLCLNSENYSYEKKTLPNKVNASYEGEMLATT